MRITNLLLIGILGVGISLAARAAEAVGEVAYSRGVLTGQLEDEPPRIIGKGAGLFNGETLNTGSRAFALVSLIDGTRMTLRPNTTFKIENVSIKQGSENALISLIRGGLRAITGFISKRKPDSFRVVTSVATIGIRGTEFDARLCEGTECQEEEDAIGETAQRETRAVGRITLLKGKASATGDGQETRVLAVGAAVYERDQIQTGIKSYMVIAFNDKTRVTLSPTTIFRIEEHEFNPKQRDENNSFLSFLQGGLRLITGTIGRINQKSFRVTTPTATIGIRGTGFDLMCEGACVGTDAMRDPARDTLLGKFVNFFMRPAYAQGTRNGMYAKVWSGIIELKFGKRSMWLSNGQTAFLRNKLSQPRLVTDIPDRLRSMGGAPRPDKVRIDPDLFSESSQTGIKPGLYVNVRQGDIGVKGADGNTINIGAGEAAVAGKDGAVRLAYVPAFQKFDKIPNPARFNTRVERMMNLFGEKGADKESLECKIR